MDALEQAALRSEAEICRLRATQLTIIRGLDVAQIRMSDGSRSMVDWVSARLDISHDTARALVNTARSIPDWIHLDLATAVIGWERCIEETRLHTLGLEDDRIRWSRGLDLGGVRRLAARHRRMSHRDETTAFTGQHVVIQPSLDESAWRLHGMLAGLEGRIVGKALHQRGDHLTTADDGHLPTGLRSAMALVSVRQDSLDPTTESGNEGGEPIVTVTIHAEAMTGANGEAGAATTAGTRIGPNTLDRLLCQGSVELDITADDATVLGLGPTTRVIPPRLKRAILARNSGCVVDGCSSRYRLGAHHITPRSRGGTHHADNLATLCWTHHHVTVHGLGYRIDPNSPTGRRRLTPPPQTAPLGASP